MLDKVDFRAKTITRDRNIAIKGPDQQEYIVIPSVYAPVGGGGGTGKERGRKKIYICLKMVQGLYAENYRTPMKDDLNK